MAPRTNSFSSTPTAPNQPRDEHALASAAAQREVEREMDSLAYTSASPTSNPGSYAPREGGKKVTAGFFKQRGASRGFVPPQAEEDTVGDRGVSASEDEGAQGGGTQPLNLGRKGRRSADESAPPYMG
jgi:hypothetical protein